MTESELPQITFASVKECESLDGENSSDSEYQHALEVVFPNDDPHRRKSSIVATANARELALQHQTASCFVHSLLETNMDHHAHGEGGGDGRDYRALAEMADEEPSGGGNGSYTRSRLLTKKQLADMAWGVRELSRRLTSLRVKMKVQSIFVLTKAHDEALIADTREVTQWLLSADRGAQYTVYVEQTLEGNKKFDAQGLMAEDPSFSKRLKYWTNELAARHPHTFDFVITLGGDGTVLYASWLFQRIVPPVLSFSMGSLGFLTKFDYGNYRETLTAAFQDGVTVSLRLRFEGTVMRAHKKPDGLPRDLVEELVGEESEGTRTHYPDGSYEILNDIVVDRGPNATMSSMELFGDDEHFTTVQADGVCVATPTGSTAYNLAAGGSLCHPENPVILVTAICAHTLSFRPIILPDTMVLRVGVGYDARTSSWASFDGRERVELHAGDYVTISASRYPFANVMPQSRRSEDWVKSISRTLQWNARKRQKSFQEWKPE